VVSLGIFSVVLPTEPYALRSTQPLKVSTRDFSLGKGGRCFWLTNYHPCSAETSRKPGALIYPEPLGPPRPVAGDLYFYFTCSPTHPTLTNLHAFLAPYYSQLFCSKHLCLFTQNKPWIPTRATFYDETITKVLVHFPCVPGLSLALLSKSETRSSQ